MIAAGDQIRGFSVPSTLTEQLRADDCVGHPVVFVVYLQDGNEDDAHILRGFRDLQPSFDAAGINLAGIGVEPIESHRKFAEALDLKFPLLSDNKLQMVTALGLGSMRLDETGKQSLQIGRQVVFYDASSKVVKVWSECGPETPKEVLQFATDWLNREPARDIVQHAPVLLIPNVLPAALCGRLMQLWETENEDSGFMKQVDGKTVGMTDYSHKIRRDHFMTSGPEHDEVKSLITARVLPEIFKAFNYNVTRREDFRIACYDSSRGGYFRPHRDNTTDGTAHRRFAMSLLLNDEYTGGYLRFPEFGQHRYRPSAGAAVIFSCSLLHEATDVTEGRRFVLLSFFYGEAEAKRREEYARRSGQQYRA